jgi:hypothetical protein
MAHNMVDRSYDNVLLKLQAIFDQNEDMLAVILENLQIGRLDDAMAQYTRLQDNLIGISMELDNYPPGNIDLYHSIDSFNDQLSHKDVLDLLKPIEERSLPAPPLPHACDICFQSHVIAIFIHQSSLYSLVILFPFVSIDR